MVRAEGYAFAHVYTKSIPVRLSADEIDEENCLPGAGSNMLRRSGAMSIRWLTNQEPTIRPPPPDDSVQSKLQRRPSSIFARSYRPCCLLIVIGMLFITGSLVPAVWRAVGRDGICGVFSLAQYILPWGCWLLGVWSLDIAVNASVDQRQYMSLWCKGDTKSFSGS